MYPVRDACVWSMAMCIHQRNLGPNIDVGACWMQAEVVYYL